MRHATARSHAESDHARELTRRGQAEAAEVARLLVAAGVTPDHAVVSGATRARGTWQALERECGPCGVSYDDTLYSASAETVLEVLRLLPDESHTAVYVGHNPAAEYVAAVLSDGEGEPGAMRDLIRGMSPATAAVFETTGPWGDLTPGSARLQHVFRPSRS
jgi:phosphohistidine phosphatase